MRSGGKQTRMTLVHDEPNRLCRALPRVLARLRPKGEVEARGGSTSPSFDLDASLLRSGRAELEVLYVSQGGNPS